MNRPLLLSVGLLGLALLPVQAGPSADQILRQMSDTLAAAQTFRFSATRELDAGLLGELDGLAGRTKVDVLVQRPDKLSVRSVGPKGTKLFLADGRSLTMFDEKSNYYSVSRIPGSIDALVDALDEKYGFVPPLADYAVSSPYNELRSSSKSISYLGRETLGGFLGLGGVACHRIGLAGDLADAELWIGVKDNLPQKLVATFKQLPAKPQLRIRFSDWDLAAQATSADFVFTPPKGATRIEMWTVSKMQKATTKP